MQSYLDVSLLAVMGGALLLLILLLAFFVILNRKSEALEERIAALSDELKALKGTLTESESKLGESERRLKICDQTVAYLSDHEQQLEDRLSMAEKSAGELREEIAGLKARLDEKVKRLEETRPENSPVIEARELLRGGMDPAEVASRTGLSASEVEVIAKVIPRAQALRQAAARQDERASVAAPEEISEPAPVRHHVASLRARNAYGISLHRPR